MFRLFVLLPSSWGIILEYTKQNKNTSFKVSWGAEAVRLGKKLDWPSSQVEPRLTNSRQVKPSPQCASTSSSPTARQFSLQWVHIKSDQTPIKVWSKTVKGRTKYDSRLAKVWPNSDQSPTQVWQTSDQSLAKSWPNSDQSLTKVWPKSPLGLGVFFKHKSR